jgi:glycosyltransferase involved in cell wall biosynthesis
MAKKLSVTIVIPVYNEQDELAERVETLFGYCQTHIDSYDWEIVIADNASTDHTLDIARSLSKKYSRVHALHLDKKGRGRAVKYAWQQSKSDILVYMDVDLSTDLRHFPPLLQSLERGYDIAIGTRNAVGSRVYGRNLLRTITSKGYIMLIKLFFWVRFTDAQCGFKAVTKDVVKNIIPYIKDDAWFFDTELLIYAEKAHLRIYEEPVTWIDNPGSTVRVMKTAQGDLEGLKRLFFTRPWNKNNKTN